LNPPLLNDGVTSPKMEQEGQPHPTKTRQSDGTCNIKKIYQKRSKKPNASAVKFNLSKTLNILHIFSDGERRHKLRNSSF
jgi:hypothetical protein